MDDAAHGNEYPVTPGPSPPSMVAEPAEAAILDELSIIAHSLRRNPDLRWMVLCLIKEREALEKEVVARLHVLPIGTVDWRTGRVELPIEFDALGCCECDE